MSLAVAREAARQFFARAQLQLPVDLNRAVSWRGLTLVLRDDWASTLCARVYPEQRIIAVNGKQHRLRQRFSTAHELGHFVLGHDELEIDHGIEAIFGDEQESYQVVGDLEREATAFAVELLMPGSWVKTAAVQDPSGIVSVIQANCDVSEQAAWYRIMDLKVGPFEPPHRRRRR